MKIFLLAHQDDEVFLLPHIMNSEQKLFIYLTNGVSEGASISQLNRRILEAGSGLSTADYSIGNKDKK